MPPINRNPVPQRHRRPADKARVRQDILAVTAALLKEKGYEKFSLREVARLLSGEARTESSYAAAKDLIAPH